MERHRSTSFHLFSKALGDSSTRSQGIAFLDTDLLLMYLDVGFPKSYFVATANDQILVGAINEWNVQRLSRGCPLYH
jgi:hypothetical protein